MFIQEVRDCENEDCTDIVGILDGEIVWVSHAPSDIPPEVRLNLDYPEVEERRKGKPKKKLRWREPSAEEAAAMHWTEGDRARMREGARKRGL